VSIRIDKLHTEAKIEVDAK